MFHGFRVTTVGAVARTVGMEQKNDAIASNIVHMHTYNLNITYNKLYCVSRMWLSGYDEVSWLPLNFHV